MTSFDRPADGEIPSVARAVYLGPGRARWTPGSYAEVVAAVAGGLLDESHHVELKREIPAGPAGNKELGRDLAACAVDGGVIVVGVSDDASAAGTVVDVDLPGLAERIDQVARSRVTPPLSVLTRALPNPTQPDRGVLVVEIPPSPDAPHMTDDQYWGRGDRGKLPLADAQVRELLFTRAAAQAAAGRRLDRFVAGALERVADNPGGTLYVLAVPRTPRPDAVADFLYASTAPDALDHLTTAAGRAVEQSVGQFMPNIHSKWLAYHRLTEGVELRANSGSPEEGTWPGVLALQFGTDGSIGLICGDGTYVADLGWNDQLYLPGRAYIGLTRTVLAVAAAVADRAGYIGSWDLGVVIDRIAGAVDDSRSIRFHGAASINRYAVRYPERTYRRTSTATTAELASTPGTVTGRLLLPLFQVLNTVEYHQPHLHDLHTPAATP